jgi:hypothetical protein
MVTHFVGVYHNPNDFLDFFKEFGFSPRQVLHLAFAYDDEKKRPFDDAHPYTLIKLFDQCNLDKAGIKKLLNEDPNPEPNVDKLVGSVTLGQRLIIDGKFDKLMEALDEKMTPSDILDILKGKNIRGENVFHVVICHKEYESFKILGQLVSKYKIPEKEGIDLLFTKKNVNPSSKEDRPLQNKVNTPIQTAFLFETTHHIPDFLELTKLSPDGILQVVARLEEEFVDVSQSTHTEVYTLRNLSRLAQALLDPEKNNRGDSVDIIISQVEDDLNQFSNFPMSWVKVFETCKTIASHATVKRRIMKIPSKQAQVTVLPNPPAPKLQKFA